MLPGQDNSSQKKSYDQIYFSHIHDWSQRQQYQQELDILLSLLDLSLNQKLLDIGCGTGNALRYIQNKIGLKGVGFEFAETTKPFHKDLEIVFGDAHHLPFPDSSFDCVIALHVIGHVADPHQVLGEIFRVLKPNGQIGIITPNHYFVKTHWPFNILKIIPYKRDITVLRYYTKSSLKEELQRSDFSVSQCFYSGKLPPFFKKRSGSDWLRERIFAVGKKK